MRFPQQRALLLWLAVGWIAVLVLPWSAIGGRGFFAVAWLGTYPLDPKTAPAAVQLVVLHRLWLLPFALMLIGATVIALRDRRASAAMAMAGAVGLATLGAVAFAIDLGGWTWPPLASIFGPLYFATFYYGIKDWWPGLIWIIGVGTYLLAIPLILMIRNRQAAPAAA